MYIIEVIPLSVMPPQVPQILSYFFDQTLPRGAVVEVQIQKKKVKAIVVSSAPLEEKKIALKKSAFQLKKLSQVISEESHVSHQQFQIALWLAKHYYAPLGLSLKTVLPPFFGKKNYTTSLELLPEEIPPSELAAPLPLFIEARAHQTVETLEPYIKEAVKQGGQVLLICPDATTLAALYAAVKEFGESALVSSGLSNAEYYKAWQKIADGTCKIVCATRVGLFLPFRDLWTVIVEDPFHESYKSDMSPRYNAPDAALKVADLYGARTIFISPIPNLNIAYAIDQKAFQLQREREPLRPSVEIVDISYERKTGNYSVLSRLLQKQLISAIAAQSRILLVSARRAHSGILACTNCGTFTKCPNCEIPMRVHKTTESMLVCYHCSHYQSFPKSCSNCHSTQLSPAGIAGSQKIHEQVLRFLSEQKIEGVVPFIFDSDLTTDAEQERELLEAIQKASQPIVIATQMLFSHRYTQQFDLIGIINADALMSNADFRAEERYFYHYEKLLDLRPAKMVIQTYNPDNAAIGLAAQEDYGSFYHQELTARKLLAYPPFSRLIKLTFSHASEKKAAYEARALNEKLRMAIARHGLPDKVKILGPNPASISKERNQYRFSIILKVSPDIEALDALLRYVPTAWSIDVDPKQML